MTLPMPAISEFAAPADWRVVEFISDLHLQREEPETVAMFARYLRASTADAIFMLGDLFEVWVGDDSLDEAGSFEAECCAAIAQAANVRPMFFMHGNRDFLIGQHFAEHTGVQLLGDPTVLVFAGERWLLSHGDALCLDDVEYQKFRALARNPQWQAQLLSLPLAARRAQGKSARAQSEARKHSPEAFYGDVDTAAALQWLIDAGSHTLIHGHTHRPAEHVLSGDENVQARRVVLSDWDLAANPPRAEVMRLSAKGLERVPLVPM
ncbi:UDP-2,3-diacylglucosamine diphosphatase [Diaphorobacter sp. HDW4A]|uniref:UDP-2,3-diacylglucosamine diphosphatase n=1 Tax=Diaphorobacter sp. HDW4A TaxID=2714924 RepID=UPI00140E5632|nr:UDP-2,3-diacylglucosamine diphosphatase [Diaphorobacter sp. HDW4A]QIL79377.1 UDP-2,3-diacylglucosamine diphosphatase [Diaphorobacter sp. HDW4A]